MPNSVRPKPLLHAEPTTQRISRVVVTGMGLVRQSRTGDVSWTYLLSSSNWSVVAFGLDTLPFAQNPSAYSSSSTRSDLRGHPAGRISSCDPGKDARMKFAACLPTGVIGGAATASSHCWCRSGQLRLPGSGRIRSWPHGGARRGRRSRRERSTPREPARDGGVAVH